MASYNMQQQLPSCYGISVPSQKQQIFVPSLQGNVQKRPVPSSSDAPPPKVARVDSEGVGWTCHKCGNHNYEGRTHCNMRSCGVARDGVGPTLSTAGSGAASGPGWKCEKCDNHNYEHRLFCNMRSCGAIRPSLGGSAVGLLAMLSNVPAVSNLQALTQAANTAGSKIPAGSWVCLGCGNINFPTRTTCNAKQCGQERSLVDGGPPKADVGVRSVILPGSWTCSSCQNINWSNRTVCNKRSCGLARSQADGGPPDPSTLQLHEGSWACRHCSNVNFAQRTVCNKNGCGQPRGS
eukprot:TRINITY_DN67236_c0_g1_i1.p1 TRINITY_DN67236_c0_g1~~TRINITY_DN67236_c0_g1_i1.p1  ORF type:complete len:312 (-),score=42.14 TRINITY_DN67236_c0_g1_i1:180-1058(-)